MKFKANDFLESLNKELSFSEIKEVQKAFIAYEIGLDSINDEQSAILEDIMDYYMDNDMINYFLDQSIIDYAKEKFDI